MLSLLFSCIFYAFDLGVHRNLKRCGDFKLLFETFAHENADFVLAEVSFASSCVYAHHVLCVCVCVVRVCVFARTHYMESP